MKMKKLLSMIMVGMLTVACVAGCGKRTERGVSEGENTLNIRAYKGGYGDDYLKALISAFESLYAEEGYKVNIVTANSSIQGSTVVNEFLLGANNGIDMYVTNNVSPDSILSSCMEAGLDMGAADLTDVYESKPITSDKTEEDITIAEKLRDGFLQLQVCNGEEADYQDIPYGFALRTSPSGFVVNKELLESYGLEIPKTTDELIHCYQTIAAKTDETGVYPNAWAGSNASGYWYMVEDVWVAQYSGIENYNKFLTMEYSDNLEEGWKVYEDEGWVKSLEVMEVLLNQDYAPNKTLSMDHTTAQHKLLSGEAVFMANGAWLQNEMAANYEEAAKQVIMIQTPVISALADKIGLTGGDAVLSQIVGLVDEGKTDEEVISAMPEVTKEQVAAVREARAIYYEKGVEETIILNAHSKKLDIAKLFLRFLASDDGLQIMYDYSTSYGAYMPLEELDESQQKSQFLNSVNDIAKREGAQFVHRSYLGMRSFFNTAFFPKNGQVEKVIASSRGKLTAQQIMDEELAFVKESWLKKVAEYQQ